MIYLIYWFQNWGLVRIISFKIWYRHLTSCSTGSDTSVKRVAVVEKGQASRTPAASTGSKGTQVLAEICLTPSTGGVNDCPQQPSSLGYCPSQVDAVWRNASD